MIFEIQPSITGEQINDPQSLDSIAEENMAKAISGHGVFIYDAAATIARYGSASMVATAIKECDMQHAWVRIHGASRPEPVTPTVSLITALKQAEIGVAGWGWCQGHDVESEAELALTTLNEFGLQDYVADSLTVGRKSKASTGGISVAKDKTR